MFCLLAETPPFGQDFQMFSADGINWALTPISAHILELCVYRIRGTDNVTLNCAENEFSVPCSIPD